MTILEHQNIFQVRNINRKQTINSNRWTISFTNLETQIINVAKTSVFPAVKERYDAVKYAIGGDFEQEVALELSLFSVSLPQVAIDTQFIAKFNDGVKAVQKFAEMEDMEVVFMDYVDGSASAIMQLWHSFVGDKKTGAIGFKRDFVLPEAMFYVYGPDAPGYDLDARAIPYLQSYKLVNLFPKNVNLGEHADAADVRKVTVTFAIDNVYPVDMHTYTYAATGHSNLQDRYKPTFDSLASGTA